MISEPVKTEKTVKRIKTIQNAHYKDIDTGQFREVTIIDKDGNKTVQREPIKERRFIPAKTKEVEDVVITWNVEVDINGLREVHEFADEASANNFVLGAR